MVYAASGACHPCSTTKAAATKSTGSNVQAYLEHFRRDNICHSTWIMKRRVVEFEDCFVAFRKVQQQLLDQVQEGSVADKLCTDPV